MATLNTTTNTSTPATAFSTSPQPTPPDFSFTSLPSTSASSNVTNSTSKIPTPLPQPAPVVDGSKIGGTIAPLPASYPTNTTARTNLGTSMDTFVNTATANNATAANAADPATDKSQNISAIQGLIQKLSGKGAATEQVYANEGVDADRQKLTDLNTQAAATAKSYQDRIDELKLNNSTGQFGGAVDGEIGMLNFKKNSELANIAIQQSMASNNYSNAMTIATRKIAAEFEPMETELQNRTQLYELYQNDLSDSEKTQLQFGLDIAKQNITALKDAKTDAYKMAIQYGADPSVISALGDAQNIGDVYKALSGVTSGQGITGTNTGKVVNGYDLTTYATDPAYAGKVQTASSTIQTALGNTPTPQTIQSYLDTYAKGTPITGLMVAQAASQYGVDPNTLLSIMKVETQLGTDNSKGSKQNNFGNVGNTDSVMAAGGSVPMKSAQDGVNAVAQQLASRKVSTSQAINGTPGGNGTDPRIASAPLLLQPAIRSMTSNGTLYIDKSKLDTTNQAMAKIFAAKNNVPLLDSAEVTTIQGLDNATKNLNVMKGNFDQLAPSGGLLGKLYFKVSAPINKLFDSDYGASVKAYQSNRDNLFQQINALAGSNPRINTQELITAANALPKLDELNTDTLKDGEKKIAIVQQYLQNAIGTILPNYDSTQKVINGATYKVNTDGSATRIK